MNCKDTVFPGRYDKLIWALALISLNVMGAILFWFWKQGATARAIARHNVLERIKQTGSDTEKAEDE